MRFSLPFVLDCLISWLLSHWAIDELFDGRHISGGHFSVEPKPVQRRHIGDRSYWAGQHPVLPDSEHAPGARLRGAVHGED